MTVTPKSTRKTTTTTRTAPVSVVSLNNPAGTYTVKPGDTLSKIAAANGLARRLARAVGGEPPVHQRPEPHPGRAEAGSLSRRPRRAGAAPRPGEVRRGRL